ncbi:hypothetical protein KEM56_006469 [Ascosphaera pollenicola]|nr:hypothetical protein KEM56_006469 [Ascosphaera pollenicola]
MASRIEVRQLTEEDIPGAVYAIQEAFMDDPYFKWIYPDMKTFNKERNYHSLKNRYLWGMEQGLFYVAREITPAFPGDEKNPPRPETSKVVGVSSWLPPHPLSEGLTWGMWWSDWKLSFRQLLTNARYMGRGGLNVHRYHIWKEVQDEAIKEDWTDKRGYYFCNVIAVAPGQQGKGIGKKLIKIVTDRADEEGLHCYLESSKQHPNLAIYERFGFETVKEITCRDEKDYCTLWCMVRPPVHPEPTKEKK